VVVETTTSWCYVGAGLRLRTKLIGPEYALQINALDAGLKVFFSRRVKGKAGEDPVERQNAEVGLMPVVADEENEYGYSAENRHMVQSFLKGLRPSENFNDGVGVAELLMATYMRPEKEKTLALPPPGRFHPDGRQGDVEPEEGLAGECYRLLTSSSIFFHQPLMRSKGE
jgi:hypothetical protein